MPTTRTVPARPVLLIALTSALRLTPDSATAHWRPLSDGLDGPAAAGRALFTMAHASSG
ncbi:hypothetical protein ACIP2Y_03635 [Streptomyces sviceus]|uniref:hypothetical protein n=1 Tax=Streptomyces sviceus TaxID=285530 RepID=UPI0037FF6ECA